MTTQRTEAQAVRAKIAALLAKTVANGCTEDEQAVAMQLAAALATRHGISMESMRAPGDTSKAKGIWSKHKDWLPHQALAAQAAAELFGVQCNAYNLGAGGVYFVGREELVDLTEDTMFWLFRQIEELYRQALPKGMSKRERAEFRKTFKAACALRTYERATEAMEKMRGDQQEAMKATGQNALVVQDYFKTLRQEQRAHWDEVQAKHERVLADWAKKNPEAAKREAKREAKRRGPRERNIPMGNGTRAGYDAGDRIKLRKEVD